MTYEIEMRNGKEVSRKEIQSVRALAPQAQVEIVGSKGTFSVALAKLLARLRSCEGGYTSVNPIGYYGAYQFDIGTWGGYQGYPNAAAAPPAAQDQRLGKRINDAAGILGHHVVVAWVCKTSIDNGREFQGRQISRPTLAT